MAESCKTDCPIYLLAKGHVACHPLVRRAVEERSLHAMDAMAETPEAASFGSLTARVIDEVDQRIEMYNAAIENDADGCGGLRLNSIGGRTALVCSGFDIEKLKGILDSQRDLIKRLS